MADIAIFRINYKSDFILTLNSDAGWLSPFCIKFWTGAPSQAYYAYYDGMSYTHCAPVEGEPTKLLVQFDDHHLTIGDLKFQIGYHFTVDDFPTTVEDEVINQASVIIEVDDAPAQVMLDLNGETAPEIEFSLPAYANEAQRIANEEARIAAEQQRIANEEARIAAETIRQQNEQQRIDQETARVNEFATLKSQSQAATRDANAAATLANEKAQLAADKAALAQQKAEYAQQQGGYAKDQGDYAKNQGNYAKEQGEIAQADHERAEADHGIAADDHTQAGNDHTRAESDHTRAESDHAAVEAYVDSLGAFDISAYHATGSVLAKYADLTAALGTNGANIPDKLRKGGMSVKFVLSSDNKYVQARCMAQNFTTDTTQWQGVDDEPIAGSKNLVLSGGTLSKIRDISTINTDASSLIGNWVVDGTDITFEGTGMNGTFTSHTNPNKSSTTRPYFRFTNFKVGAKYRLRLKGIVNSSRTDVLGFFYSARQTDLWSSAKLIDIDGNEVICNNGGYLDCVFLAQTDKTYLGFSLDAYGINDSITISDFSITEYSDISDLDAKFSEDIEGINEDIGELKEKVYAEDIIPVRWVPGNNVGFSFSTEDGQNGTFTCIGSLSNNLTRPYIDLNELVGGATYNLRFKMDMDDGNTSSKKSLDVYYDTPYSKAAASMSKLVDVDGNNVVARDGVEVNIDFVANSSKRYLTLITWGLNNGDKFTISNFSLLRKKSVQDINDELNEVKETISQEDFSDYDELPLGDFKINAAGTIVYSSYIACIPYFGIEYKFKLPDGIMCQVKYGTNYNVAGDPDTWYTDGSTEEVARGTNDNYLCQMVRFKKTDGSTVSIDTIKGYINSGDIKIYYARNDADIARRNYENEKYVKSAIYRLGLTSEERSSISGVPSITTIVHVSDVHGDIKRFENAVEYANKLGAHAIFSSGDGVMYYGPDGVGYMKDVIDRYPTIPFLNCIGNHEVIKRDVMSDIDNTYLFENFISKFKEQGGYKSIPSQVADMPYYYVDLVAQGLRIITINQFDGGYGGAYNAAGHLGQTQITWLCNTLLSTPENYGVLIMMHSAEDRTVIPEAFSAWHQSVYWTGGNAEDNLYANGLYVSTARPIKSIVDAFISKTTIELTYTETKGGESVTINADFSNVANGVEFICYVTGHRHTDNIGYVANTTNMQLMLNICSSNCHYPRQSYMSFAECEDIPRGDTGAVQDAFNVYGIDRQNGRVKMARVGSNVNFEGIERKFLIAPYKD